MPAKKRSSKKSKSTAYKFSVHVKKPKSVTKKSLKKKSLSKKSSKKSKSMKGKKTWVGCVAKARKELGVKGFVAIKKGTPLYKRAKELYDGQ